MFERMRQAGIQVVEYNPIGSGADPDHRDHRKLLVIDNRVAITGGLNVTGVYLNQTIGDNPEQMRWRDTDVRSRARSSTIPGPVRQDLVEQHGPPLPPAPARADDAARHAEVEAIDGAPMDDHPVIYETLLSAIALAKTSVHLTTGFFGPPER